MYVWKTELTIEKLKKATNELEVRLNIAVDNMEDALCNGWVPNRLAQEWIQQGLVYIGHADEVIDKYYMNHQMDDSTASVLLHCPCPCETLSRRTLNSRAILRLNDILDHTDAGKKYHAEEEGGMEARLWRHQGREEPVPSSQMMIATWNRGLPGSYLHRFQFHRAWVTRYYVNSYRI
jgi:hypothetical protein